MKQIKAIVATGHLDKQGEMLAPEALYGMAEQANKAYIPMWVEHDIAQPPIGRMTHAEVVQMDDGVLAVQSTREVWESSADIANIKSDGRKMVIHEVDVATFESSGFKIKVQRGGEFALEDAESSSGVQVGVGSDCLIT